MKNPGDYCRNNSNHDGKGLQNQPADAFIIEHHAQQHAYNRKPPKDSTIFLKKNAKYYNSAQTPVKKIKDRQQTAFFRKHAAQRPQKIVTEQKQHSGRNRDQQEEHFAFYNFTHIYLKRRPSKDSPDSFLLLPFE